MSIEAIRPSDKPLGRKAYGHIGHLPSSRLGPGDHKCPEGQGRIATLKCRDRHDRVIVQEKLDGSNVAVAKVHGIVVPLIRAGYRAVSSPREQHRLFARWALERLDLFDSLLAEGERLCGEWLAQAHSTRYDLPHEPFVAFDFMTGEARVDHDTFVRRIGTTLPVPRTIHVGGPFSVEAATEAIEDRSHHGAIDPIEGAVWRVERKGSVDFLAKWVRAGKVDGLYLPEISGRPEIWNWRP